VAWSVRDASIRADTLLIGGPVQQNDRFVNPSTSISLSFG
jgi:hypothetical protein